MGAVHFFTLPWAPHMAQLFPDITPPARVCGIYTPTRSPSIQCTINTGEQWNEGLTPWMSSLLFSTS